MESSNIRHGVVHDDLEVYNITQAVMVDTMTESKCVTEPSVTALETLHNNFPQFCLNTVLSNFVLLLSKNF